MDTFTKLQIAALNTAYARGGPTPAQAEAGNYKKGRVVIQGLPIAIECPRGSYRTGVDASGKAWRSFQPNHYGHFAGRDFQKGADGDEVDVFLGPMPESPRAWVINQLNASGGFDEAKVMLGFASQEDAKAAYYGAYEAGWDRAGAIVPCSVEQLRWWLKYGATTKPFEAASLPYDGDSSMNETIAWDSAAKPVNTDLAGLIYRLRREDAEGLMLDSVTIADILADADGVLALDALVVPLSQVEAKMGQMQRVMAAADGGLEVLALQVTQPFKQKGTTNVAAVFELSDGQTVSVFFHNPDTTPNKLTPDDEMVSWKWLLNRKDVTILVAPEQGRDLNVREVARRIMALAAKNSPRFAAANTKKAERMQNIEGLKQGIEAKEAELGQLNTEIERLQGLKEAGGNEPAPAVDPQPEPADPNGLTPKQRAWAEKVLANEDARPWRDVRKAKKMLGVEDDTSVETAATASIMAKKLSDYDWSALRNGDVPPVVAEAARNYAVPVDALAEALLARAPDGTGSSEQNADRAFIQSAIDGTADFYDKAVTDRLAELAGKYAEGEMADLMKQAKTAAKNFFIAEFQKKVG